ncbi:hypothetical protein [Enterobacteria phage UAB_Phi20]|nr:hypothetical protein BI085_gp47 [Enterobacteria phage UAB_Phi20]ADW81955.1 hypothetical protein [Enterobacteria phage UAB_Phi20]
MTWVGLYMAGWVGQAMVAHFPTLFSISLILEPQL